MKMTDGLFHRVFRRSRRLPGPQRHLIVDIGAARLADRGAFDVVVLPNLYGDILSDIAAESRLGEMAGSANRRAGGVFEPSTARRGHRGRDVASPSGC